MLHVSLLDIGEGVLNTHFFCQDIIDYSEWKEMKLRVRMQGKIKFFSKKITFNSHPKSGLVRLTPDIHQLTNVLETQWDKKPGEILSGVLHLTQAATTTLFYGPVPNF